MAPPWFRMFVRHAYALGVVAEDVEQLELLRRLACDAGQGYLFSRPRPAAELPPASPAGPVR